MSIEKNQEFIIGIEDFGNEGEGIGRVEGMTVFVKDGVPGDVARIKIVKAKKNYAYGRLMELVNPSPDRVKPVCPHARPCGGCQLMHVSYEKQLQWKQEKVLNCLQRIGGVFDAREKMEPIIGMTDAGEGKEFVVEVTDGKTSTGGVESRICYRYRNKAQFPVRRSKDGSIAIGFYAGRTHDVIDTEHCYLQDAINDEIVKRIRGFIEEYEIEPYDEEQHTGLVRHILTRVGRKTGEIMVCLVINGEKLVGIQPRGIGEKSKSGNPIKNVEGELVSLLQDIPGMTSISLNVNQDKTNRILGASCRTLWGSDTITDYIGEVKYQINPLSFYQVNPVQTEKLYGKALEYANLSGSETVWDLYCGIGTISLFLAQKAKKVMGVEIVPAAIEDAKKNASLNGFTNTEFFVGKAEEVLPREYKKNGIYADVIVVDPPRKGCDIVAVQTMIKMAPKRIVYVSCDPATLARDVKLLTEGGYVLERFCATDMFPHTAHVETIVALRRTNM